MQASAHIDTFARDNLPPPDQWPEFLLDGPDVAYPERLNCAAELVDAMVARGQGGRVALRWRQGADQAAMTYAELQALTNRIAHVLVEDRSEEHTSELQSPCNLVCRLLLEKKKKNINNQYNDNTYMKEHDNGHLHKKYQV